MADQEQNATQSPVTQTESPVAPTESPTAPTELPAAPTELPADPAEAPVSPGKDPAAPTEPPADIPTTSTNTPTDPSDTPATSSSDSPTALCDAPTAPSPEPDLIATDPLTAESLEESDLGGFMASPLSPADVEAELEAIAAESSPAAETSSPLQEAELPKEAAPAAVSTEPSKSAASQTVKCKAERNRRKEDRSIEHVLKVLQSLATPEERLAALCKKYADLFEENRSMQLHQKQTERKATQLLKEKEQLQSEHSKAVLTRTRLESLCRELQRQYKVVKDESLIRVREEEEKRKEVSAKFQSTLSEISNLMQENTVKNTLLHKENKELGQKLTSLVEQYDMREQHVEKLLKHKDVEVQLAEAKMVKANLQGQEEKERHLQEKAKLLEELTEYQKRCNQLAANEVQLRNQLSLYMDKYEEFQDTLNKSNQVFSSFKVEMDKMTKKIKKLETETGSWKVRWESSNKALLEMAEEKQKKDTVLLNAQKKVAQLEKLCRALQAERNTLQDQLRNIQGCPKSKNRNSKSKGNSPEPNDPPTTNGTATAAPDTTIPNCCSHHDS